jgi:hypothetical protein
MIPINNSDTAWLIVTDYNQDNNLPYAELREDILNPAINDGDVQSSSTIGGYEYGHYKHPAFELDWSFCVGAQWSGQVGIESTMSEHVGGTWYYSPYVGGNLHGPD